MEKQEKAEFAKQVAAHVAESIVCPHEVTETEAVQMRSFLEGRKAFYESIRKTLTATIVGTVCMLVLWGLVAYIRAFSPGG